MERQQATFADVEHRLIGIHRTAYYAWIRHVVTLASGALTVLVALQNSYIPDNPQGLELLIMCWVGLVLSILLGVVALFGEALTPLDCVRELREVRRHYGDNVAAEWFERDVGKNPRKGFLYAQKALPWFFVGALSCLCAFAIQNLPY